MSQHRIRRTPKPLATEQLLKDLEPAPPADPATLDGIRAEVTHGLCARSPVISTFESQEEWDTFLRSWRQRLQPEGPEEELLVEEIALTQWRQRRLGRFETEQVNRQLREAESAWAADAHAGDSREQLAADLRHRLLHASVPSAEDMQRLQRHEAHLLRSYKRRLLDLDDLQRRRRAREQQAAAEQASVNSTQLRNCNSSPPPVEQPQFDVLPPFPNRASPFPGPRPVPSPAPLEPRNSQIARPAYGQPGYRFHVDDE
ncbi:MAG: hypothetical protein K0Q72_1217 [Armatimonadetes bacterium]|nr:hypothetical protein [Armatimonadota bacterium]